MPLRTTLVVASLLFALVAGSAHAGAPPTGKYDCVIGSNSILFGTLTIKTGKKYAHRGSKGTFTTSGKTLKLKGGDLAGMRGRWYKGTDGPYEIALRNPRDDFESIYCTKR